MNAPTQEMHFRATKIFMNLSCFDYTPFLRIEQHLFILHSGKFYCFSSTFHLGFMLFLFTIFLCVKHSVCSINFWYDIASNQKHCNACKVSRQTAKVVSVSHFGVNLISTNFPGENEKIAETNMLSQCQP
jgi:hypothetical protein